jgi:HlyD family secretion protein
MRSLTSLFLLAAACIVALAAFPGCGNGAKGIDASGTFETEETIVSTEATGTIRRFDLLEGQVLAAGEVVGYVDSTQLYLRKKQLEAQIRSVLAQRPDASAQIAALEEQLATATRERDRISALRSSGSATQKQLDDANSALAVVEKQLRALRSTLDIATRSLDRQADPVALQVAQVEDQLAKCRIVNPVAGTVLTKYVQANEMATPGKALYKIADLTTLNLRAYVTGRQFSGVKLGQSVTVLTDAPGGGVKEHPGTISWISDKAEFTPKTIQTKEERANLVYALKIRVANDGTLKIGMYGDVRF